MRALVATLLALTSCAPSAPFEEPAALLPEAPRCEQTSCATPPSTLPVPFTGQSLRARRSIVIREAPHADAKPLGTLAQDMRVAFRAVVPGGPDCEAWVELVPKGFVCERYLEDNFRLPRVRELPRLDEGSLTPGRYARVVGVRPRSFETLRDAKRGKRGRLIKGSTTVELLEEVKLGKRSFYETKDRGWIAAGNLRVHQPSDFAGLDRAALRRHPLPVAWVQSRGRDLASLVFVRASPSSDAEVVNALPFRTVVALAAPAEDESWARLGDEGYVARADLHVAKRTARPLGVGGHERWIDVDLDEQVLVAYEGDEPVFATLISSGGRGHETPEGLFRIWIKFAETDMTGRMGGDGYEVASVPWTMFFFGDFALHTAYWHDRFGVAGSHGCINLSPQDARALYQWSGPEVPLGWSMAYAHRDEGSLVRVRSRSWPSELFPMSAAQAYLLNR